MARTAQKEKADEIADAGAAQAARLRDEIDRGRTGDKVAAPDPAAAPLGTDDEAAGNPPTARRVRIARAHETGRTDAGPGAERPPGRTGLQPPRRGNAVAVAVLALCAAFVLVVLALWLG